MKIILNAVNSILLLLIKFYKTFISPVLGNNCRFHPTCSTYSVEALKTHGPIKGLWLSMKRVAKCHPFHPGGYDPVPLPEIKVKLIENKYMNSNG